MPRPKTSERDRKTRNAAASAKTEGGAAASSQAPAPSGITPAEMTVETQIRELEKARDFAEKKGRAAAAVTATVAITRLLRLLPDKPGRPPSRSKPGPRPKTSGRNRKTRKVAAGAKTEGGAAASSEAPAPPAIPPAEMTVETLIRALEEDRKLAVDKGRAAAAVTATVEMGRLLRLLPDKPGQSPAPPAKFDGNYNDAARRILFLLGLAAKERAQEADKEADKEPDKANGQERDRPS